MQLQSMYQEIILDHYRNPHGRGLREPFDGEAHHVNPTCGDEITVRVTSDLTDSRAVIRQALRGFFGAHLRGEPVPPLLDRPSI